MTPEQTSATEFNDLLERPASRCSDYDNECKDVTDHSVCFCGGVQFAKDGTMYETPMADGYCPFLLGMESSNR